ncbi:hypothetical protein Hanom_Chr07g00675801 [Helianthus anomalus]
MSVLFHRELILWQNHTDLNIWLWSEAVVAITPIVVVVKRVVMFSSGVESTTYTRLWWWGFSGLLERDRGDDDGLGL